jgi:tripeptide aminopeptidase
MDMHGIVDYFLELVKIDSPSKNERALADKLKRDLMELGFQVEEDDAGSKVNGNAGNIIARLRGNAQKPTILFGAHMDTVSKTPEIKPVINNGKIFSDGTTILSADDKAGICAVIQGIRSALKEGAEHGDIEVVFTICEEIGLKGSKNLDVKKLKAGMGFILDSSGEVGKIITSAPAQNKLYFKIKGKPTHAGVEPEKGISAVKVAGVALANMNFGRIDQETTANIGIIKGGSATNIITDLVEMEGEARSRNEEKLEKQTEHMIEAVKDAAEKYGAQVEYRVDSSYPAFKFDENSPIVRYAVRAVEKIGLKPQAAPSGGGSDANILNGKGIPCINMGSGFFNPHSPEECITIENLVNLSKLVKALL